MPRGLGHRRAAFSRGLDRTPGRSLAKAVQSAGLEQGLLLLMWESHDHFIRFIPPVVVAEARIDEAIGIFEIDVGAAVGRRGRRY